LSKSANSQRRPWWNTYKYRDILGIVPIHQPYEIHREEDDDDDNGDGDEQEEDGDDEYDGGEDTLEVAIVERPMWDVALPGRYVKSYE